ncbi:MAG: murein transglycosylase [Alphaproteobacteria bacterium]|nr:MAG: murein transglycosylase [Alphaproteobacteria bacterium]
MRRGRWMGVIAGSAVLLLGACAAEAAKCGSTGANFETWKETFSAEAKNNGIKPRALAALMDTSYSAATIRADRGQHSFKLSLSAFMAKRGAPAIVARGRVLKRSNAALFASIERHYGVPPGPLLAIWGMETGFGNITGNQNTLSAVATLAYDCRRTEYFTEQLYAALALIDRGTLSASARGAMHGEVGHTQFLPKNVRLYGADGDGDGRIDLNSKADALASTANFLKGHGWVRGEGYQPGQTNFGAIQGWNAATVYQKAIAIMGKQIDG